jgi:hypothetical protein
MGTKRNSVNNLLSSNLMPANIDNCALPIVNGFHLQRYPGSILHAGLVDLIDALPKGLTLVEIGSFAGESTTMFALRAKAVIAVDTWSFVRGAEVEHMFDQRVRLFSNIIKIKEDSVAAAQMFQDGTVDAVYIDASHDYHSVYSDILAWYPKIRLGGYICGHDYCTKYPGVVTAVTQCIGRIESVFCDGSWMKQKSMAPASTLF